jgi:hypothetical protein
MPHVMTDDTANDPSHFGNGEEFRPSWSVAFSGVARWVGQSSDRNPSDVVDRGRRVTAVTRYWQRKDTEVCRERHHLQIRAVSEKAWIDHGVGDARKRGEHPIDQPMLARHQRRVVGSGQPLRKANDLFKAGLPCSVRKRYCTLDHKRMIWRAVISSLYATHRVRQLSGIENVRHHDLSATTLEKIAPRVLDTDSGSYWPPLGQQLRDHGAPGPAGCADNKNFWIGHKRRSGVIFSSWYDIVP